MDLSRPLLPGTFAHALNHLLDYAVDLSHFDARFRHDDTGAPAEPDPNTKMTQRVQRREHDAAQIRTWLAQHPNDRRGPKGTLRTSNRTDNESAKMATSKGVRQGYTGVAAVESAHQIIVEAQAHGTGAEQALLVPIVQATQAHRSAHPRITADAGSQSHANLQALESMQVPALIADNDLRRRDARFATQARHLVLPNPLQNKTPKPASTACITPRDFGYDPIARPCVCPVGTSLYRRGQARVTKGDVGEHFRGATRSCMRSSIRPTGAHSTGGASPP